MSTCELRNHCRSDPVQVQSTGGAPSLLPSKLLVCAVHCFYELPAIVLKCWAEAPIKIARMTLTIKLDGNWNSFQLANNTPPLSVTGSVIAPSARMAGAQPGGASIKTPVRCNVSRGWLPASQPGSQPASQPASQLDSYQAPTNQSRKSSASAKWWFGTTKASAHTIFLVWFPHPWGAQLGATSPGTLTPLHL